MQTFTFTHNGKSITFSNYDIEDAFALADSLIGFRSDGYWKMVDEDQYVWTKISPTTIPLKVSKNVSNLV